MKRFLGVLLALALLAPMCPAKPKWYKDKTVWIVFGISVAADFAATHWSHECREKFGPAPCEGGYGDYKGREAVRAITVGVIDGVSLGLRQNDSKVWWAIPIGLAAYNGSVAYRQTLVGCPPGQEFVYGTKFTCHVADESMIRITLPELK